MFEQMRANVGKLLKGIDRSEPGLRERVRRPGGVEVTGVVRILGLLGVGLPSHPGGDV